MDEIRRGAMAKMGRALIGGLGAGVALTGGQQGRVYGANEPVPERAYPSDMSGKAQASLNSPKSDPLRQARWKTAQPLENQIAEIEGYGKAYRLNNFMHASEVGTYLPTLRSTAPWWRASVAMDRRKKQASAVQTLQEQITKIMTDPLEQLDATINDAIGAFLAELQRP